MENLTWFLYNFNVRISIWTNEPRLPRKRRGTWGAKTRKKRYAKLLLFGRKVKDCAVNGRCELHGGLSTGPKKPEGKAICSNNSYKHGVHCAEIRDITKKYTEYKIMLLKLSCSLYQ